MPLSRRCGERQILATSSTNSERCTTLPFTVPRPSNPNFEKTMGCSSSRGASATADTILVEPGPAEAGDAGDDTQEDRRRSFEKIASGGLSRSGSTMSSWRQISMIKLSPHKSFEKLRGTGLKAAGRAAFSDAMKRDNFKRGTTFSRHSGESADLFSIVGGVAGNDPSLEVLDLSEHQQFTWLSTAQRLDVLGKIAWVAPQGAIPQLTVPYGHDCHAPRCGGEKPCGLRNSRSSATAWTCRYCAGSRWSPVSQVGPSCKPMQSGVVVAECNERAARRNAEDATAHDPWRGKGDRPCAAPAATR